MMPHRPTIVSAGIASAEKADADALHAGPQAFKFTSLYKVERMPVMSDTWPLVIATSKQLWEQLTVEKPSLQDRLNAPALYEAWHAAFDVAIEVICTLALTPLPRSTLQR